MTRAEIEALREQLSWHHDLESFYLPVRMLRDLLDTIDRLEARLRDADIALAAARSTQ